MLDIFTSVCLLVYNCREILFLKSIKGALYEPVPVRHEICGIFCLLLGTGCVTYSVKGKKKLTCTHAIIDLICTADYSLKLAQHGINFKN